MLFLPYILLKVTKGHQEMLPKGQNRSKIAKNVNIHQWLQFFLHAYPYNTNKYYTQSYSDLKGH